MKTLLLKHKTNSFSSAIKAIMVTIALASFSTKTFAKEKSYNELQAELVINFSQHVSWPENINSKVKNICIMEDNPVFPYLHKLIKEDKTRDIIITRKHENDYLEDCTILFVNEYYEGYLERLLLKVVGKPILTFGNIRDFAKKGGIAQFTLRNNRVEFILNMKQAKISHLRFAEEILLISDTVN